MSGNCGDYLSHVQIGGGDKITTDSIDEALIIN
jgi:hypothetical protein